MTDKEKIREEVARIQLYTQSEVLKQILDFIDSLQEEPVSDDFEEALAREWQGYNDRGAAIVDALEDNAQELTFSKGFYRGWNYPKQLPVSKAIDESLAKNAEVNDALQEGLRNGKKAVLIIGDDMPDYKCIFIPNGFSAKIEGNKVIFTKDKEPASNEVSEMEFKRLDIPELEKAAMNYSKFYTCIQAFKVGAEQAFKAGANWQKQQTLDSNALLYNARMEGMEIGKAEIMSKVKRYLDKVDINSDDYYDQIDDCYDNLCEMVKDKED